MNKRLLSFLVFTFISFSTLASEELEERFGLLSGQEAKEVFMRIMPTKKGMIVIASIKMVNHNESMQSTENASSD